MREITRGALEFCGYLPSVPLVRQQDESQTQQHVLKAGCMPVAEQSDLERDLKSLLFSSFPLDMIKQKNLLSQEHIDPYNGNRLYS